MELKELKCKNCGAQIKVEENAKEATCKFCNTTFSVETHENFGYEFEKGRIKAQKEELNNKLNNVSDGLQSSFDSANEVFSSKEVKTVGKVFVGIFVVVFICIIAFIGFVSYNIFSDFKETDTEFEEKFNETKDKIESTRNQAEIDSFNYTYETSAGSISMFFLEGVLDKICTNNKKNKEHKITVLYNEIESDDYNVITDLKSSLQKKYTIPTQDVIELSFDYDDDGYIYKAVLKDK